MASSAELLERLELFGIRLGLERIRALLERLGEPQRRIAPVLVAGTNGKGSTAALVAAIATAAGYRTGLYTSPHLESVRERVRIDGEAVPERRLASALERVLAAAEEEPTYFEALTAAALLELAEREVELALLEVGLGGRLDATNATDPVLSLITEIGLDHQEHLGTTLDAIAVEKAGILRPGTPALARVGEPEARAALERVAVELGTPLRFVDAEAGLERAAGGAVVLRTATARYELAPPLGGEHQLGNLALAVAAAETLAERGWGRIDRQAIEAGVAGCRWPGRTEWVDLGERGRVLLDGAHNPAAARALVGYLERHVSEYVLLFGVLRGKRFEEMLPPLAQGATATFLTAAASPRAVPPAELEPSVAARPVVVIERPAEALTAALGVGPPVVVCGSLYLVGAVRRELRERFGVPAAAEDTPTWSRSVD